MMVMCVIVTVGTVIQTASINIGMFLAGRVLAGVAVGYVRFPKFKPGIYTITMNPV